MPSNKLKLNYFYLKMVAYHIEIIIVVFSPSLFSYPADTNLKIYGKVKSPICKS